MIINRIITRDLTVMPSQIAKDDRLSLKTKGALFVILSAYDRLDNRLRDTVYHGWCPDVSKDDWADITKELKEVGYLQTKGSEIYLVLPMGYEPIAMNDERVAIRTSNVLKKDRVELFDEFWAQYPNKKAKGKAREVWMRMKINSVLYNSIMSGLDRAKDSDEWKQDNGKFIPHPATWLRGERWLDEGREVEAPDVVDLKD